MGFDYRCLNMEALAAHPIGCNCSEEDKAKWEAMKDALLLQLWDGKFNKIQLGKMKWRLEPMFDLEDIRKEGNEKAGRSHSDSAEAGDESK